jgi:formate dehydrogenase subunit delta
MSSEGPEQIVRMANDIGNFFRAEPNRQTALDGIFNHINKFWTRRMRQRLLEYVGHGGSELDELPLAAVAQVTVASAPAAQAMPASALAAVAAAK